MDDNFIRSVQKRLADIDKKLNATTYQPRAEYAGGVARKANADLPSPNMAGAIFYDTTYGVLQIDTATEYVIAGIFTRAFASLPAAGLQGRQVYDTTSNVMLYDTSASWKQFSTFPVYTVASLPNPGYAGQVAFASNGRKGGEGAGTGTGVPVFWNSVTSAWLCFHDNSVVLA